MSAITLVPIGNAQDDLLNRLAKVVGEVFRATVLLQPHSFDASLAFDSYRNQYNSSTFLSLLLRKHYDAESKILGVTDYDLFVPVLTYVFGEAQLSGKVAVVSCFRLRPELYGLPEDALLTESRLEKEAIHELGHTFGLIHCSDDRCVMHPSTYAEDIDLKETRLCINCLAQLFSNPPPVIAESHS